MRILTTFPGRFGDVLWALPTIRAISERYAVPVDLIIAGEFGGLLPLLRLQPYLQRVEAEGDWPTAVRVPPMIAGLVGDQIDAEYDHVFHLGYRRWPELPLPHEIYLNLADPTICLPPDLQRPWITVDPLHATDLAVGFTEAWFELKLGLLSSIDLQLGWALLTQLTPTGSRWTTEATGLCVMPCDWLTAAQMIAGAKGFFGDCSALHVLAVALGKRCVIMEPMEARHNPIFWPLGTDGPQVRAVRGNDGDFTFDARACAAVLKEELARAR